MHKLRLTAAQLSVNRSRDWRLALPDSDKQTPVKATQVEHTIKHAQTHMDKCTVSRVAS